MTPNPPFPPTAKPVPERARATRELLKYVPQISLKERDRRWDKARKRMLMAGIDALVFLGNDIYWGMGMANLRYLLQVDAQLGAYAVFPLAGDPVVWHGVVHMNRPTSMYLSTQEWFADVRTYGGMTAIVDELKSRGLDRSRLGLVGFSSTIQTTPTLLHDDVVNLERMLPHAQLSDASAILQDMRMVKSEEEIDILRCAGKIARKVVDAMVAAARPGVTEAELYADMIRTQIANGGEPNVFNLLASGPVEHPPEELWHLLHGCEQPLTPTTRPLRQGDIVVAEWHTKYGGYRCHTEYTVYLGKQAPKELRRIWDVSVECLEASKAALTAGRTIREAVAMIRRPAERAGLDFVELGFHAMGTASPEFPTVVYREGFGSNALNGHNIGEFVLEEGMTFGNNIDLHDARWKPDVGCMLSDFMVVRPREAECLIGTPTELAQVG
ncbi:MAG TPA: Xaa-Pro peptidase family protein [Stellaceae bacterium]|nr:Xaa-Pro peptidase family protein [Stellaceae bacterium]